MIYSCIFQFDIQTLLHIKHSEIIVFKPNFLSKLEAMFTFLCVNYSLYPYPKLKYTFQIVYFSLYSLLLIYSESKYLIFPLYPISRCLSFPFVVQLIYLTGQPRLLNTFLNNSGKDSCLSITLYSNPPDVEKKLIYKCFIYYYWCYVDKLEIIPKHLLTVFVKWCVISKFCSQSNLRKKLLPARHPSHVSCTYLGENFHNPN